MLLLTCLESKAARLVKLLSKDNEIKGTIDNENLELMRIITLSYKVDRAINPGRKNVESFLL